MAVVHQTSATSSGTSTSITLTKPSGVAAGDFLLAAFRADGEVTATPSGWTLLAGGGTNQYHVYYKIAGGSEPASYVWTQDSAFAFRGGISRYTGVDATTPIDVAASAVFGGPSTSPAAGPVTTVSANAMVIGGAFSFSGSAITPPGGLTERWELQGVEHASAIQTGAGSTGTETWTLSASGFWAAWVAGLKDATASATINAPTFVATTEQVFAPALVPTLYINPSFVPSGEQVFAPQVLTTGQVGPNFVTSGEQVFTPSVQVTSGPQAVTPNFVPTTAQVFAPAVVAARQVSPTFVASAEQVFTPSLSLSGLAPSRVNAAHEPAVRVIVDHEPL